MASWFEDPEHRSRVLSRNTALARARGAVPCRPRVSRVKPGDIDFCTGVRDRAPWGVALWRYTDDPSHVIEMLFRDFRTAVACAITVAASTAEH